MTLLKRLDMHIEDMRSKIGINVAKSPMSTYIYTRRYLGEFIHKRFKTSDVAFGQLHENIPWEFLDDILKDKGLAVDTARHYLAILKKICRMAFKEGHAEKRYFVNFKLPKENRKAPRALSREDFEEIRDLEIPASRVTHNIARDLFLFACFCGLAYIDVQRLFPHHIGTTVEGRKYIRTYRKKTDVEAFIPLHPIAEQIISLYNTTDDSKPIFPLPSRDMIWFEIHELGFAHQFKHNLSYHQSRHTFGTLLASAGVPMESISKMMGHTNIRTTQGYAKLPMTRFRRIWID